MKHTPTLLITLLLAPLAALHAADVPPVKPNILWIVMGGRASYFKRWSSTREWEWS